MKSIHNESIMKIFVIFADHHLWVCWWRSFRWTGRMAHEENVSGYRYPITLREKELAASDVHRAVHRNIISIVRPTRCTNAWNLFYFGMQLYMFRTVLNSWWWTERSSVTCRVSFRNKIYLIYWCI